MQHDHDDTVRPVTVAMQRMLLVASILVFISGFQLFVLTGNTERFFAWTIRLPLTAAYLGAGYWASGVLEYLASRERAWSNIRAAVPAVWVFTTLTLIVSLAHLDVFHLDSVWGWAWFAVYASVPVVLGVILVRQMRVPGGDAPRTARLPDWLRLVLSAHLAVLTLLGLGLLVVPERADDLWPWGLTPITRGAIGAWLIGWATVLAQTIWENDWARSRVPLAGYLVWGVLTLVALARYGDAVDWAAAESWVFALFVLSIVAVGGYGVIRSRRLAHQLSPAAEPLRPAD